MLLETYPPSGTETGNTFMALYGGTGTCLQSQTLNDSTYKKISTSLGPGTYYVLVSAFSNGPYAMAVRTSGIDRVSFTALGSKSADQGIYGVQDNPHVFPVTNNFTPPPNPVVTMTVGSMVNRYAATNSDDWFTFTLP
jgi:hypothetical protein